MARTVIVFIEYDQEIGNPRELEKIHEEVNSRYESVGGVYAQVVSPEKATEIRMNLGALFDGEDGDATAPRLPARTPEPQPFPGDGDPR